MPHLNIRATDKCQKTVPNGNGKDHGIKKKMVGMVQTNRNGKMTDIYTRIDPSAKGMLMGCYPGNRKYITGLVLSCREKNVSLIIEDKDTVIHLAQHEILLRPSELSKTLLADQEITQFISK